MKPSPELLTKLRKLLALAQSGVDGERVNAASKLNTLLAQHGVSLADLADRTKEPACFRFRGKVESDLLAQVIFRVTRTSRMKWRKGRSDAIVELTPEQSIDVATMWRSVQKAWRSEVKKLQRAAFIAFISRNNLANPDSDDSEPDGSELSPEELALIGSLYRSGERLHLSRQITA